MPEELEDQNQDPSSTESPEGSQNPDPESGHSDSTSQTHSPQGGQGSGEERTSLEFSDPMLRGKSPEEVEEAFQLLRRANSEQGAMLTRLQSQGSQGNTTPDVPTDDELDTTNFFDDPDKKLQAFQNRIARTIEEAVAPFKQNLEAQAAMTARQQLRNEYDDFAAYEPVINTLLQKQGKDPAKASIGELQQLYFTAVGYARKKGIAVGSDARTKETNVTQNNQQPPASPPNRRPSSAPPAPSGEKSKLRELTETERQLARSWGMTHEEYLKYQEMENDNVVTPGYSFE